MASVTVRLEDFESGNLPRVCAKSGVPTNTQVPVTYEQLPGWTPLLLLFGIFPFLLAALAAEWHDAGRVPVVPRYAARWRIASRVRRAAGSAAAWALGAGAVAFLVPLVLSVAFPGTLVLVLLIGAGLALLIAVAAALMAMMQVPPGRLDVESDTLELRRVHRRFVVAVEEQAEFLHPSA